MNSKYEWEQKPYLHPTGTALMKHFTKHLLNIPNLLSHVGEITSGGRMVQWLGMEAPACHACEPGSAQHLPNAQSAPSSTA